MGSGGSDDGTGGVMSWEVAKGSRNGVAGYVAFNADLPGRPGVVFERLCDAVDYAFERNHELALETAPKQARLTTRRTSHDDDKFYQERKRTDSHDNA
jgi:hypothetical protein